MNDARQQEETLFDAARKLTDPVQRKAFVDAACADNPELRRRLLILLSAEPDADKFFEESGAALNAPGDAAESPAEKAEQGDTVRVTLPPEEQPGARIGHYKLREKLGEGGCGVVYVAEQEEPVRRRVALKVIKLGMDTRQVVARFEAERQALAIMDHPNIAKVLDAGTTENGRPYFVMELVRGIRITDYCDQNHLDTNQRLELFIQVCNAVQHAHQKGIIHRDLKPSNILVTLHDGVPVPKVIDFGIAKATQGRLTDGTVYTELHQFIGTPAYMSPEQAEMSGLDIDTRSDIYSLGVLLYELLTGDTPFDAKDLLKQGLDGIRRTIREIEPPRPSTRLATLTDAQRTTVAKARSTDSVKLRSQLRGDLDWVVMKCLEKNRSRRYETANGLAMDLKRFLHNEPVVARPPSATYRLEKLVRRNKLAFAAGAIVFLALIVGLGTTTWALFREQVARKEADLRRQESEKARADEKQQRLRAEAEELTARRFAYASDMNLVQQALAANNLGRAREVLQRNRPQPGQVDLRGWEWRYLWQRCRGDALFTLRKRPDTHLFAVFADSGKLVALRHDYGAVELWDMASHRQVGELPGFGYCRALAVSSDGTLLAYGSTNANGRFMVELWNVATKTAVTQLQLDGEAMSLAFTPDGKRLAVYAKDPIVLLWNLERQEIIRKIPATSEAGEHKGVVLFSRDGKWMAIGGTDGRVRLFDANTYELKSRFSASSEGITALSFSPSGALLASGSGYADTAVKLWVVPTGEHAGTLTGHNAWVSGLAFAPDGKSLASADGDQTIRLWDALNHEQISLLRGHLDEVHTLAFSPDGRRLVTGSKDGEVCIWDPNLKHADEVEVVASSAVHLVRFLPDSKSFVSVNHDGSLSLWDARELREKEKISKLGSDNMSCVISPDERTMAVGDRNGRIKIWDFVARREVTTFKSHDAPVSPWRFLARGKVLLSGDSTSVVKRWEVGSWREIASWQIDPNLSAVTVSPDERLLVTGLPSGTIKMWNTVDGHELAAFSGHLGVVTVVAFSPEGRLLATGGLDGLAKLWDPITRKERAVLKGHLLGVHSIGFSPDGQRLATGSNAKEAIKVWDLSTGQELLNLKGQGAQFRQTVFSPDGNLLVSFNDQDKLHVWRAPPLMEIDAIEMADAKSN
ncbi:MAG: hypothetical protein DME21_02865 [Verrucomicrobia bacterium]|nr:MAG: hypothetical protein DME21_02865 [Verrucomicrobiota bacterium]